MTIREDLSRILWDVLADALADGVPGHEGVVAVVDDATDAVLHWLGGIDPDASPELIRWHLVNDRAVITELRAEVQRLGAIERTMT